MLGPLNISLGDYDLSSQNGFLPDPSSSWKLSNPYYSAWEVIVDQLPSYLRSLRLRKEVDKMPILSISNLHSERELQRAYHLLSFMTHGYIWGGQSPAEVCSFRQSRSNLVLRDSRNSPLRYPYLS
jgi:indoleamine 2,3-dioxygenase